ncbi:MAG: hypothetical protein M1457_08690 [bacterium]|nr:hypothetical protein [bacterium]
MSLEQILERINELKTENAEKDEVIRVQQTQIDELENRIRELDAKNTDLENDISEMKAAALKTEELLTRLSDVLE